MSCRQRFRVSGASRTVPGSIEQPGGFSLLEVIIATAMLMGAAVVLSRLAGMGREQSLFVIVALLLPVFEMSTSMS